MSTIKLNSEQQAFVEDNMGLAGFMAKKLKDHTPLEFEELMSFCYLGLVKAVQRFDPERGIKFATFAAQVIQNVVFHENRNYKNKRSKDCFLEDIVKSSTAPDPDGISWEGIIHDTLRPMDDQVIDQILIQYLASPSVTSKLNTREATILKLLMLNPEASQLELGRMTGQSQVNVSRILKSMRQKLRAQLAG